jgi:hypothetical protein
MTVVATTLDSSQSASISAARPPLAPTSPARAARPFTARFSSPALGTLVRTNPIALATGDLGGIAVRARVAVVTRRPRSPIFLERTDIDLEGPRRARLAG